MRILLFTGDRIGAQRAGPAIRCVELARILATHLDVAIASLHPIDIDIPSVELLSSAGHNRRQLRALAIRSDIILLQGFVLALFPFLTHLGKYLIIDLYDPVILENLVHAGPRFRGRVFSWQLHHVNRQLVHGDFFVCATERQRDYWLGALSVLGRLNPEQYSQDPDFQRLVAVVPLGIPAVPPKHTQKVVKGVMPGIGPNDIMLLWVGGIWQWFDPLTLIRAVGLVSKQRPEIKLLFLGTQHPNPDIPEMPILEESRRLARELGLLNRFVFFREGWVPFDERQNYLLEADIGVSAHLETAESRLAFRTRVLDYIWAGLPMVLTRGDYLADFVERENVGKTVLPADVESWKEAIASLASNHEYRQEIRTRLQGLAPRFSWEKVSEPLLHYCNSPYHTARASWFVTQFVPLLRSAYEYWKRFRQWWH